MAVAKLGSNTTVAAADLASAAHAVNAMQSGRLGDGSLGKHAGMRVIVRNGNLCTEYIALGDNPTSPWAPLNGAAVVTPA